MANEEIKEYELTSDNEVIDTTTGEIIPVEDNEGLTGPEKALIGGAVVAIGAIGYGIGKGVEFLVKKTKNEWIPAIKQKSEEKKAAKAAKKAADKVADSIEDVDTDKEDED